MIYGSCFDVYVKDKTCACRIDFDNYITAFNLKTCSARACNCTVFDFEARFNDFIMLILFRFFWATFCAVYFCSIFIKTALYLSR